ncbi:hypothetical protein AMTRI_Chr12g275630 [Amborella trichopoda]
MGRFSPRRSRRSRSRSYSPRGRGISRSRSGSPPVRRKRYDDPRDRYRDRERHSNRFRDRDRRSSGPSGLLIRNISLDARPEDLRIPFERFGPVKDVYLPKNYYTGEPRGFGFVKFRNPDDAAEAKQQMNHQIIGGREITIVFAEENRKTPQEMRVNARVSGRYMGGSLRRRTPLRSPRRRYRSYSRTPTSPRHDSRDRGRDDYYSEQRSPSPPSDREEYKPRRRSVSPRSLSLSDRDEREEYKPRRRSPSPRSLSPSDRNEREEYKPRCSSPISRSLSPSDHNEREEYKPRRRTPSSTSPADRDETEDYRPRHRSPSPRFPSPVRGDYKSQRGLPSPDENGSRPGRSTRSYSSPS